MAEGKGVQLEWAIVYWALKNAADPQVLQQRVQDFPALEEYGNGAVSYTHLTLPTIYSV